MRSTLAILLLPYIAYSQAHRTIDLIDLDDQLYRQVVVDREAGTVFGSPNNLLARGWQDDALRLPQRSWSRRHCLQDGATTAG